MCNQCSQNEAICAKLKNNSLSIQRNRGWHRGPDPNPQLDQAKHRQLTDHEAGPLPTGRPPGSEAEAMRSRRPPTQVRSRRRHQQQRET